MSERMHTWKTVKIFISSTFKDMELERDRLARAFANIQESLFTRRLHLIPYDLRWREQGEKDLVHWCLDMVEQSHYFIAILGQRYGWRPQHDAGGNPNHKRISITEMEVRQALAVIPREKRFFCFAHDSADSTESLEDQQAMARLKEFLHDAGEQIFFYQAIDEAMEIISREVETVVERDYAVEEQVDTALSSNEEALREIIDEKRRGFVGRTSYLQLLEQFCRDRSEQNFLLLYAVAGVGKSALLAQFLHNWKEQKEIPVVAHYMSMRHDSRSVRGILNSLGEQLQQLGIIEQPYVAMPRDIKSSRRVGTRR